MDLENFLEDLLVVIVLFKTRPQQSEALNTIREASGVSPCFPAVFIYDNSPEEAPVHASHLTYFHDPRNIGVSTAYNKAAALAEQKNKKWLLFLDQDTQIEPSLFQKFSESISQNPESVAFVPHVKDHAGLISPFAFALGNGRRLKFTTSKLALRKFRFINSGLLIKLSAFIAAGGYDETIPLDFSDIAFAERLKKVTDHFQVVDLALVHGFSPRQNIPAEDAIARFQHFCTGANAMGRNTGHPYLYRMRSFLHSVRLTFRYGDRRFLEIYLQRSIHG